MQAEFGLIQKDSRTDRSIIDPRHLASPDNPAESRRRRSSRDSHREVQARGRRLSFPRIVEDTARSDEPFGIPATIGYVVEFSLDLYRSA